MVVNGKVFLRLDDRDLINADLLIDDLLIKLNWLWK